MANIKVSEMTEATIFDDGDYAMIVQTNQSKKISKENMFSNLENEINTNASDISTINTNIGDLTNLSTETKTNLVSSINELKGREAYTTEELKTNKIWIDGKPIYRKVVNCGNLGNATQITIDHNITNISRFVNVSGLAQRPSDNDLLTIPYATFNENNRGGITAYVNNTSIYINTNTNRSAYAAYVILEYTKTTD